MGFMKKLFGGADGTRETMRESYLKHLRLAQTVADPDDNPHTVGLYGALATRYRVSGKSLPEQQLWAELAPFLAMPQAQAVEMLAEYVVFHEAPRQANIPLLVEAINVAAESGFTEDQKMLAIFAFLNRAPWCLLLKKELSDELQFAASEFLSTQNSDQR
jgi:hypothetical protein